MGGLLDEPKTVKAPSVQVAPPVPTVDETVGTQARKKRPRGRQETFLTGDLVPENIGKKTLLG